MQRVHSKREMATSFAPRFLPNFSIPQIPPERQSHMSTFRVVLWGGKYVFLI